MLLLLLLVLWFSLVSVAFPLSRPDMMHFTGVCTGQVLGQVLGGFMNTSWRVY